MESIYEYHMCREEQEEDNGHRIQLSCDCFLIHLYFHHVLQLDYPQRTLIPMASFSQPFLVPCDAFFSLGSTILHDMFSDTGVSQDFLDAATPHILSFAFDMAEDAASRSVGRSLLPMALVVLVATSYDDRDEIDRAIRESTEEARRVIPTVPATNKSSIDGALRKLRIDDGSCTTRECSICLEEFCNGLEVVCMPCSHVYHRGCIVRWLQTSHLCPLCRFPMPIS